MGRVRSRDTRPEVAVRKIVHGMGYRYRLHAKELPGTPDLVFRRTHKVIFVHGCFWHRHENCAFARMPKSNQEFWLNKLEGNRQRDIKNIAALEAARWRVLIIWECELHNVQELKKRIEGFLDAKR